MKEERPEEAQRKAHSLAMGRSRKRVSDVILFLEFSDQ